MQGNPETAGLVPGSKPGPQDARRERVCPMRRIIIASVLVTVLAASIEVWLIQYAGKIVDILTTSSPAQLWQEQGRSC